MKQSILGMGSVLGNIKSAVTGLTAIFLTFFNVMLVILKPLWVDIDRFIGHAIGIKFQWVLAIFLLTLFLFEFFIIIFFTRLTNQKTTYPVFALIVFVIWAAALLLLVNQTRYSFFSLISVSWFYWTIEVMFISFSVILIAGLGIIYLTPEAVFYNRVSAIAITVFSIVMAGVFITMTSHANREEATRWPAVAKTPHQDWKAEWIVPDVRKSLSKPNIWLCFRKTAELENIPEKLPAKIAADSKYWLWINGVRVVAEGGLKRGPNPFDTYYDTVDIAPYLKKGKNEIAVLVWHFGKDAFSHRDSGLAGMIFDAAAPGVSILSDSSWKALIHPAYWTAGSPDPNFRLAESNVYFDARSDIPGWTDTGFDDSSWNNAKQSGKPPVSPWNNLVPRPIPMWKDYGLKNYTPAPVMPFFSDGRPVECVLPYNAQMQPYFEINAREGLLVEVRTDDYRGGGEYNIRACYTTRDGRQSYECPAWMNGHKVIFTFPKGVEVLSLKYRETGYDTEFAGKFECSDSFYNELWQKASRTLYVTMRDNYMDCPDRERAQWWGDAVLETGESFYALSPSSHLLGAKAIRELCSWQRGDGTLYSPVPSGNWNIELPQQMLASVGWFGFWNYYMNTGDKATVAASYPAAKRYVLLWDVGRNGLLSHRPGKWNQGDWGENVDINLLESCWYYLALKGLAGMAEATGGNDDLRIYEEKMRFIRDSFRKNYWNPMAGAYRSPGYTGESDDRANALAVVAGLADAGDYQALRKVLMSEFHASPYMEKYVIEALFMMGYEADALTRMKKRYAEMVQSPLTTLWEGWKLKSYDFGGGTYNHAWSGGPLTLLSMYVAGVRPIKPGYEEYEVMPALDSLTSAECIVPSVRGQIRVAVEKIDGGFMLDLESPSGTRAIVGIPSKYSGSIMITDGNGEMIDYSNPGAKTVKLPADSDGRYARFMVWPGKWKFSAKIY